MRMERLTAWNKNGEAYYPECYRKDGCDGFGGDCSNCKFNDGVCETLAAYEDTCLTPDQIRQMDQLYREKCEELARYKAAIAEARKVQKDDKLYLRTKRNQGGLRMIITFLLGCIVGAVTMIVGAVAEAEK